MTQQRIEEITAEAQKVAKEMSEKSAEERADFVEYACNSISQLTALSQTEEPGKTCYSLKPHTKRTLRLSQRTKRKNRPGKGGFSFFLRRKNKMNLPYNRGFIIIAQVFKILDKF